MDHSEAIATFQSITGASKQESEFYLESHNWDLEKATQTYTTLQEEENKRSGPSPPRVEDYDDDDIYEEVEEEEEDNHRDPMPAQSRTFSKPTSKPAATAKKPTGGIRTLSDFNNDDDDHDGDDDDEDQTQHYFTGGEKSGLMVESAPKNKKGSGDIVNDVFDSAKRHGAVAANEKKVEKPDSFDSVGYQLGATDQGNRNVSKPKEKDPSQATVEVKVTFWNQGFTIDDGPLRHYNNPENKELIEDIQRGVVPRELQKRATTPNGLSVTLINNHNQDYVEPAKPKYVAFSGGGQSLGGASSSSSSSTTTTTTTTTSSTPVQTPTINVDQSQPTTLVQIRLANGSRLSNTFNHTHTLQDVINYINSSSGSNSNFDLLTGFPQKPITLPFSTSLKDAGLLNALLIQKLK